MYLRQMGIGSRACCKLCHAMHVSPLAGSGPSKKQVQVHATPPLRWPLCLSLSLSFLCLFYFSSTCPSFVLSPSSCLTLDRFLPLYASSLLDNHNPCSPSSRYSLLRQQLWVGKKGKDVDTARGNQRPEPSCFQLIQGCCGTLNLCRC